MSGLGYCEVTKTMPAAYTCTVCEYFWACYHAAGSGDSIRFPYLASILILFYLLIYFWIFLDG